jgi:hypothetical protein
MASNHIPDLPDLSKLSVIAQTTSERFKEINQRLLEFERTLGQMNLAVEGWVEQTPLLFERYLLGEKYGHDVSGFDREKEAEKRVCLGWKKSEAGKYRLFSKTTYENDRLALNEACPLLEAPWEVRVKALGQMKDLVSVLEHEAKKHLNEIEGKLKLQTK